MVWPCITNAAGTELYRNYDLEFEKVLSKESATRKIGVDILFEETADGYKVTFTDEDGFKAETEVEWMAVVLVKL